MGSQEISGLNLFSRCIVVAAHRKMIVLTIKQGTIMKKWLFFLEIALLIFAVFAASVVLALLSPGSSDLAAWVQAVGSIAALFIAIFVMARQNRNAARLMIRQNRHATRLIFDADRIATLRRAQSVHAVLLRSRNQINAACIRAMTSAPTDPDSLSTLTMQLTNSIEVVEEIQKRLAAIPVYDLGAFKISDGVMQATEVLDPMRTVLLQVQGEPRYAGIPMVNTALTDFLKIHREGIEKVEAGMKELKQPTSNHRGAV